MKITNSTEYKVNFGYNKQLNKELKKELDKHPDRPWAENLSRLNDQCNYLEDILVKTEHPHGKNNSQFNDYKDIFLELKTLLAEHVACTFENLKFPDREAKHYDMEYNKKAKCANDWRKEVVESISWLANDPPKSFKKHEQEVQQSLTPNNKTNAEKSAKNRTEDTTKADSTKQAKSKKKTTECVKEFIPTASSPKGFDDVAGMIVLKNKFEDGLLKSIKNPKEAKLDFEEYGKTPSRGILLYGPPGCGKTYITQALAQEAGVGLYTLSIGDVGSKYVNETPNKIQEAFDEVIDIAKETGKPCLLFMDEIDSLAFNRDERTYSEDIKQVGTLLQAMDRAKDANVFIIGATNKYKLLDPAIKRRFDDKQAVDIPDSETRVELLKLFLSKIKKGQKLLNDTESLKQISAELQGFSNDSICKISNEAADIARKRNRDDLSIRDYMQAIQETSQEKPNRQEFLDKGDISTGRIGFSSFHSVTSQIK